MSAIPKKVADRLQASVGPARGGVQWAVLTNGIDRQIHRIRIDCPVAADLICTLSFFDLNPRKFEAHQAHGASKEN